MVIWKYFIRVGGVTGILLPPTAKVVHVHEVRTEVAMWVLLDGATSPSEHVLRRFEIIGTGQEFSPDPPRVHCGTAHTGAYVWHLFEVLEEEK